MRASSNGSSQHCVIWLDRHSHKNGGTTTRYIKDALARNGWLHKLGDHHTSAAQWRALLEHVSRLGDTDGCERSGLLGKRFAIEAHELHDRERVHDRQRSFETLWVRAARALRERPNGSCCKLVLTTRVREPLDLYLSFYRWALLPRHPIHNQSQLFLQWAPPNLQSISLAWGFQASNDRAINGRFFARPLAAANTPAADSPPTPLGRIERWYAGWNATDAQRADAMLRDDFDLVWPIERHAAAMPLLARALRLPAAALTRMLAVQKVVPSFGSEDGGKVGGERSSEIAEVCPDLRACRQHVDAIAPFDRFLFARAVKRFERALESSARAGLEGY